MRENEQTGSANGGVKLILRFEGLALLAIATVAYWKLGFSWSVFCLFFLTPDLSFLGYLFGSKVGAFCYNCAHSLIGALLVIGVGFYQSNSLFETIGLIWIAHIGFDRALGYGLKYSKGFGFTHLGHIGKAAPNNSQTSENK